MLSTLEYLEKDIETKAVKILKENIKEEIDLIYKVMAITTNKDLANNCISSIKSNERLITIIDSCKDNLKDIRPVLSEEYTEMLDIIKLQVIDKIVNGIELK